MIPTDNPAATLGPVIAIGALMSLLPFLVMVATSFTKISLVLMILRNALGIQQFPSNFLLNAIALVLSLIIMEPVIKATAARLSEQPMRIATFQEFMLTVENASEPLHRFLTAASTEKSRALVMKLRVQAGATSVTPQDMGVLMPAFLLDELTRAFQIGLLIYLPFLAIDIIVATALTAMGMQMVFANVIATPLKILLFILVDGWSRLFESFVASYPPVP